MPEQNQFISFKGSRIFYRVTGNGKTVVLLHGFAEDGNIWNDLANKLKNNFRLIIPDLPGSGESTILKEEASPISIDDYAEVILHILGKESVNNCTVIGHSMGGYTTLAIAEKYPERLNGFGLFHSTAFADDLEKKKGRLNSIEFMRSNDVLSFLKTSIPGMFADTFKTEHNEVIEKLIQAGRAFTSHALIQYYEAMIERPDRTDVLKATKLPVLFIIGEKDNAIPLKQSLAQCHLPATAHVNILSASAHMGMLEENKKSTNCVEFFLDRLQEKAFIAGIN